MGLNERLLGIAVIQISLARLRDEWKSRPTEEHVMEDIKHRFLY